jgi:signal transduction histidine kinase
LIFVYTTFKYEFFDLAPVIKYEITERLNTPILLTDSDYNILYANNKLKTVFNVPQAVLKNILNTKSEVLKQDDRYYKYEFYEVNKMGHLKYIITFDDITSYLLARNALDTENVCIEEANEKLEEQIQLLKQTSRISARNYVARELHDVMGHSLVVTMKLLEVSKISYSKDKKRVVDSLEKARESVRLGFKEMLKVKENDVDAVYNVATLEREIRTMLKTVNFSGIRTNVYFRGSSQNIEEKAYDIIKKVSIELVTNTLKHSGATMLYLSIVFEKNSAFISLMDNGRGADDLTKGNGLNGIDSRLSLVGGKARYNTGEGEGFCANIVIPMQLLDKGA